MANTTTYIYANSDQSKLREFFNKIYLTVATGLLVMGCTSYLVTKSSTLTRLIFGTPLVYCLSLAPLGILMYFNNKINQISSNQANNIFYALVVSEGVLLSMFFRAHSGNLFNAFLITSGVFLASSLYGRNTTHQLSNTARLINMALWGSIIAMLVNIFIGSNMIETLISMTIVVACTALVAYKSQELENMYHQANSKESLDKLVVIGSISLFLSFINILIHILSLMGNRRE